nr:uncharacterized mitochondrial protein AtMg00810-like [Nicotiana tomentosiformis]
MVKGDTQVEGVDFHKTFFPVVKMSNVKTLLVCKLQKSLYGLRQASRQCGSGDSFVALVVYVDDIILTRTDSAKISTLKSFLHQQFKIKDLGCLGYFLGIEVIYSASGVLLHQRKFIVDLLSEFHCSDVSFILCPLDLNVKLKDNEGDPLPKSELYSSLIGKLNFLTQTRPDISFADQHLSQFMQSPCLPHMSDVLHLLRYLKGTFDYGIFFNASPDFSISAYYDSDWATCPLSLAIMFYWVVVLWFGSPRSSLLFPCPLLKLANLFTKPLPGAVRHDVLLM